MKKLLPVLLLFVFCNSLKAQTFEEWFKQKKTQKKYLVQQIAALQLYRGWAQKGYSIAKSGLNTISNIKNGELTSHTDFFNAFKSINPGIRNYAKVGDIINLQVKVVKVYKRDYKRVQQSRAFNSGEIDYIKRVYSRLLDDCVTTVDRLITVTTANTLEMKDDERLKRIEVLYRDMQDKYTFVESFGNETMLLAKARMKENSDVQTSRMINGLNP